MGVSRYECQNNKLRKRFNKFKKYVTKRIHVPLPKKGGRPPNASLMRLMQNNTKAYI